MEPDAANYSTPRSRGERAARLLVRPCQTGGSHGARRGNRHLSRDDLRRPAGSWSSAAVAADHGAARPRIAAAAAFDLRPHRGTPPLGGPFGLVGCTVVGVAVPPGDAAMDRPGRRRG